MIKKIKIYFCLLAVASISMAAKGCADKKVQKDKTEDKVELMGNTDSADISRDVNGDKSNGSRETEKVTLKESAITEPTLFYRIITPGAQQVDENGIPVNNTTVERFIVLETGSDSPLKINSISTKASKKYSTSANKMEAVNGKVLIGKRFVDNEDLKQTVQKGSTLWRIDLSPIGSPDRVDNKIGPVTLKIMQDNKTFTVKVKEEKQLSSPMYY